MTCESLLDADERTPTAKPCLGVLFARGVLGDLILAAVEGFERTQVATRADLSGPLSGHFLPICPLVLWESTCRSWRSSRGPHDPRLRVRRRSIALGSVCLVTFGH